MHEAGHEAAAPSHKYGAQAGFPAVPALSGVQTPAAPGRLHASHAPLHAVLQQTPSTQLAALHWLPAVQAAPSVFFGTQRPPAQKLVETQPESCLHLAGQLADAPSQTYGAQLGSPGAAATTLLQVPTVPARLHRLQAPAHAVLQHTPSTQLPAAHSLAPAQTAPGAFFNAQAPAAQ